MKIALLGAPGLDRAALALALENELGGRVTQLSQLYDLFAISDLEDSVLLVDVRRASAAATVALVSKVLLWHARQLVVVLGVRLNGETQRRLVANNAAICFDDRRDGLAGLLEVVRALAFQAATRPRGERVPAPSRQVLTPLTVRELTVLASVARGDDNLKIASSLAVTERTIKSHVANLLRKLRMANRTEAALLANRLGLAALT